MSCLKTVGKGVDRLTKPTFRSRYAPSEGPMDTVASRKGGQSCSDSNRCISGTNNNFLYAVFCILILRTMPFKVQYRNRIINLCHSNFKLISTLSLCGFKKVNACIWEGDHLETRKSRNATLFKPPAAPPPPHSVDISADFSVRNITELWIK